LFRNAGSKAVVLENLKLEIEVVLLAGVMTHFPTTVIKLEYLRRAVYTGPDEYADLAIKLRYL
jgi:hypothetical protein